VESSLGDGAKIKAKCGHIGEVVIGGYVACRRCDQDAIPAWVDPEDTQKICRHVEQYVFERKVWCWQCGARIRSL
jgi:hypothetical protein